MRPISQNLYCVQNRGERFKGQPDAQGAQVYSQQRGNYGGSNYQAHSQQQSPASGIAGGAAKNPSRWIEYEYPLEVCHQRFVFKSQIISERKHPIRPIIEHDVK